MEAFKIGGGGGGGGGRGGGGGGSMVMFGGGNSGSSSQSSSSTMTPEKKMILIIVLCTLVGSSIISFTIASYQKEIKAFFVELWAKLTKPKDSKDLEGPNAQTEPIKSA